MRRRGIRAIAAAVVGSGVVAATLIQLGGTHDRATSQQLARLANAGGGAPHEPSPSPPPKGQATPRLIRRTGSGAGTQTVVGPFVRNGDLGSPLAKLCTPTAGSAPTAPPGSASGGSGGMRAPGLSFVGLRQGQSPTAIDFGGDISGAAGPSDYVETINDAIGIFSRSGERRCPVVDTNTLWLGSGTVCDSNASYTDAIVLYDRAASRWFVSRFMQSGSAWFQCVAVSKTTDPAAGYFRYAFPVSTGDLPYFNDYPKFGIWRDAYYMSALADKIFQPNTKGSFVVAFQRSKMLHGQPAKEIEFFLPVVTNDGHPAQDLGLKQMSMLQPANVDGPNQPPPGSREFFVQALDDNLGWGADELAVWSFRAKWSNPSASTLKISAEFSVDPFNSSPCIPTVVHGGIEQNCIAQKGTTQKLDPLAYGFTGWRLVYRRFTTAPQNLEERVLVLAQTVVVGSGTTPKQTGIRWYILGQLGTTPTGGWRPVQSGTYSPDADSRWLPSPAMDAKGDVAIGFMVSGKGLYPSARYAGRRVTDTPNKLPRDEATLVAGEGPQKNNAEFGDYIQLVMDPKDDCRFWLAAPYYRNTSAGATHDFSTAVGRFSFKSC